MVTEAKQGKRPSISPQIQHLKYEVPKTDEVQIELFGCSYRRHVWRKKGGCAVADGRGNTAYIEGGRVQILCKQPRKSN
uniref:Uncharacterized protein n=1 Tax=Oreochromis aureus TaxID=47969 RepID=A0AAZ1Y1Y4_OREAU